MVKEQVRDERPGHDPRERRARSPLWTPTARAARPASPRSRSSRSRSASARRARSSASSTRSRSSRCPTRSRERLVFITSQFTRLNFDKFWISPPEYFELRERVEVVHRHRRLSHDRRERQRRHASRTRQRDRRHRQHVRRARRAPAPRHDVHRRAGPAERRARSCDSPTRSGSRTLGSDPAIVGKQIEVQGRKRTRRRRDAAGRRPARRARRRLDSDGTRSGRTGRTAARTISIWSAGSSPTSRWRAPRRSSLTLMRQWGHAQSRTRTCRTIRRTASRSRRFATR